MNNFIACINNVIWIFEFYREIALEILQQEEIGSFIVRDSSTHPGCYALSVRVPKFENPTGISHYLILKTQRGVKLKVINCRHMLPWSLNEKFYVLHQTCAFITLQFLGFFFTIKWKLTNKRLRSDSTCPWSIPCVKGKV